MDIGCPWSTPLTEGEFYSRFARQDAVEQAWSLVDPLLEAGNPPFATPRAPGDRPRPRAWSPPMTAGDPAGSRTDALGPRDWSVSSERLQCGHVPIGESPRCLLIEEGMAVAEAEVETSGHRQGAQ